MNLCMVGSGYVGLVSGACFADTGQSVVCADVDTAKVETLNRGGIPIYEPGLEELVRRNREAGRLTFTSDVAGAIRDADVVFVAVGTPPRGDGGAHLGAVDAVAELAAKSCSKETVLVLKSTVPVGTNRRVRRIVESSPHRIHVVSNPEFLKEGDAVSDFMKPDRIVIGVDESAFARETMERLYHPVNLSGSKIVWMDPTSAELTKYVANSMLAMRISFMNEIAAVCDAAGADVHSIRRGVGSDSRIGSKFLYAGPGYGGSCFPKDVKALVHTARELGVELDLAAATDRVNERQKGVVFRKLRRMLGEDLRGKRIAIWGVAFKPRTDDTRDSPSLTLIQALVAEGAIVRCHDPAADRGALSEFSPEQVSWSETAEDALEDSDALCLMTEWREYQNPDFKDVRSRMRTPNLVDARNVWSSYGLAEQGFEYTGIGVR